MNNNIRRINYKLTQEGYALREGYQRFFRRGWGYRRDEAGNKIPGYEVYDYSLGYVISPGNDLYDHALTFKEAVDYIRGICPGSI